MDLKFLGKIPKNLYIRKEDSYNGTSTYQSVTVKKGSKLKLSFDADEPGVFLKWDFKTEIGDIKFGVKAENTETGEKFNEVDLKRVSSHEAEHSGFITCQAYHTCKIPIFKKFSILM